MKVPFNTLSCFPLVFVAFLLLTSGCSDTQITQEAALTDTISEDHTEIINEEPPQLVQAYDDLWMEISNEQSRGILDSTKVLEANRIAIELSRYDGPTAEAFKILQFVLDAHSTGKSSEEIKEEVKEFLRKNSRLAGKTHDTCEDLCHADFNDAEDSANEDLAFDAAECIGSGVGVMLRVPNLYGVLVGLGWQGLCLGGRLWQYSRRINRAKSARERCLEKCEEERENGERPVRPT